MSDLTLANCLEVELVQRNLGTVSGRGVRINLWSWWWEEHWDWPLV